jgi:hypothetical protein
MEGSKKDAQKELIENIGSFWAFSRMIKRNL